MKKKYYKNREYKYCIGVNKCLCCGGEIHCREHNKNIKIFCEAQCAKKYYHEKKKTKNK